MTTTSSRLRKELGLFDVYVLSTGAMISSGIFLLPGIAVGLAGPAAVLACLLAGVMILPAMLSTESTEITANGSGGFRRLQRLTVWRPPIRDLVDS